MNLENKLKKAIGKVDDQSLLFSRDEKFKEINKAFDPEVKEQFKEALIIPEEGSFDRPITIIPITDVHFGSKQTNIHKLNQVLKYIEETPDCYTILLGDMMETATKRSVGLAVYDEEIDLRDQLKFLSKALSPLAKAGKIIGVFTGNHEMRVAYLTSLNPAELLAERLGVHYFGYQGYISLKVGSQAYHIFAHHGVGGGSTPAGKLNAMRRLNRVAEADIYLSGHTHGRMHDHDILMKINDETCRVEPKIRHYIVAGSFLEYWGGYAEMKLLPPSITGTIAFRLMPDQKKVHIIM